LKDLEDEILKEGEKE